MPTVTIKINGKNVTADVEARTLLVELLRRDLSMTGTHVGCDTTQCGACTVIHNDVSTKSCTLLAVQADGGDVRTIEGVGEPEKLHPVQQAFHEYHGLQCGFCTPGMVMNSIALLEENPDPNEQEIRHWLEGNLCRCTGYHNIILAVRAAAAMINGKPLPPKH